MTDYYKKDNTAKKKVESSNNKNLSLTSEMIQAHSDGRKTMSRRVIDGVPSGLSLCFDAYYFHLDKEKQFGFDGYLDGYFHFVCPWEPGDFITIANQKYLVKRVRVERLQDITSRDAIKEGIKKYSDGLYKIYTETSSFGSSNPIRSFASLWDSIFKDNVKKCWSANPAVWVVEYEKVDNKWIDEEEIKKTKDKIALEEKYRNAKLVKYSGPFLVHEKMFAFVEEYLGFCEDNYTIPEPFLFVPRVKNVLPHIEDIFQDIDETAELEDENITERFSGVAEITEAWDKFLALNKDEAVVYYECYKEKVDIQDSIKLFESRKDFVGWVNEDE